MSNSREYLCSTCGRFLFRARGPLFQLVIDITCPERRCKRANSKDLGAVQTVTDKQRRIWSATRRRWRLERQQQQQCAVA